MKAFQKDPDDILDALEDIRESAQELNPEEDLTWGNLPNYDSEGYDYD